MKLLARTHKTPVRQRRTYIDSTPLRTKAIYPKETPISNFEKLSRATTGRHEVWRSKHLATGKIFYLKRISTTLEEEFNKQLESTGKADPEIFNSADPSRFDPARFKFEAEREITASRLFVLLKGDFIHSPESLMLIKELRSEKNTTHPYYWIASQEVPNFISFDQLGHSNGEKFFLGKEGETRVWLNDSENVAIDGRIFLKFLMILLAETDINTQNAGIAGTGEKRKIASFDHEFCLQIFRGNTMNHYEFAVKLASGQTESPMPFIDLAKNLKIRRREEVRKQTIAHLAKYVEDGTEIKEIFMQISYDYPKGYKEIIRQMGKDFYANAGAFVLADILLTSNWDKQPDTAHAIFTRPENQARYATFISKHLGNGNLQSMSKAL